MKITRRGKKWRVGNSVFKTREQARTALRQLNQPKAKKAKKAAGVAGNRTFVFTYTDLEDNYTFESVAKNQTEALNNLRTVVEDPRIPDSVYWAVQFLSADDISEIR